MHLYSLIHTHSHSLTHTQGIPQSQGVFFPNWTHDNRSSDIKGAEFYAEGNEASACERQTASYEELCPAQVRTVIKPDADASHMDTWKKDVAFRLTEEVIKVIKDTYQPS